MVIVPNQDGSRMLNLIPYEGLDDFTLYVPVGLERSATASTANVSAIRTLLNLVSPDHSRRAYSYGENVELKDSGEFRTLICSCFRGQYFSLTLRRSDNKRNPTNGQSNHAPAKLLKGKGRPPKSGYAVTRKGPSSRFLFGRHQYVNALFRVIFRANGTNGEFVPQAGLVVVAGSTATSKTKIIQGIIHRYLTELIKTKTKPEHRRPHLVTFEDPIETLYYEKPEIATRCGLDYTPRQKGTDAEDLRSTLRDCLRQTPDAVYIGETRDLADWRELIAFAGTGHLIFTTCHAGSLTEIMGTLFKAVRADSAAKRSALASRLVAVIQLRRCTLALHKKETSQSNAASKETILPAVWKRTPISINDLASDGLAALLPHGSTARQATVRYCYGRNYFANELTDSKIELKPKDSAHSQFYKREIRKLAVRFDLEGL